MAATTSAVARMMRTCCIWATLRLQLLLFFQTVVCTSRITTNLHIPMYSHYAFPACHKSFIRNDLWILILQEWPHNADDGLLKHPTDLVDCAIPWMDVHLCLETHKLIAVAARSHHRTSRIDMNRFINDSKTVSKRSSMVFWIWIYIYIYLPQD